MNKHLRDLTVGPPGNWHYLQKETNYYVTGVTFRQLIERVAQHRQNNNIPIGDDLTAEVEEAICDRMSVEDQVTYCNKGMRIPKSVAWQHVESFLKTAGAYLASGGALVDQTEAERRAAICAKCPLNVGLSGCGACRATVDAFRAEILQRSTSQDAGLRACGICGCENKSQVHLPIETLRAGSDKDYSPNPACWKLRGGVNESTV